MTDNPKQAIETMRELLTDGRYEVSDADRDALLNISDTIRLLGVSKYSDHRHEFIRRRNLILAKEVGGVADALNDRDAAEAIVGHINTDKDGSPETNKDYRVAFRKFGLLAGDDDEELCQWCGQALNPKVVTEVDAQDTRVNASLANLSPEQAEKVYSIVQMMDEPEVKNTFFGGG